MHFNSTHLQTKMAVLKSCCCFTNVRSGSIASAVYSLVLASISCGIIAYNLYVYGLTNASRATPDTQQEINQLAENLSLDFDPRDFNNTITYNKYVLDLEAHLIYQSIFLSGLVIASLLFCTSVLLLVGISLDKRSLLLPWIFVMVCNIILDISTLIYHTTLYRSLTYIIIEMVIWLLLTVQNIYCVLCVYSQYQEYRAGRGTRDFVRQLNARIAYHSDLQQVHINQGPIIINGHLPIGVTSSVQSHRIPQTGGTHVTTTLLVSAPEYSIAAGQLPQYHEATSADNPPDPSHKDEPPSTLRDVIGSDSPPPPYSS